jgi:hypothetical protein
MRTLLLVTGWVLLTVSLSACDTGDPSDTDDGTPDGGSSDGDTDGDTDGDADSGSDGGADGDTDSDVGITEGPCEGEPVFSCSVEYGTCTHGGGVGGGGQWISTSSYQQMGESFKAPAGLTSIKAIEFKIGEDSGTTREFSFANFVKDVGTTLLVEPIPFETKQDAGAGTIYCAKLGGVAVEPGQEYWFILDGADGGGKMWVPVTNDSKPGTKIVTTKDGEKWNYAQGNMDTLFAVF